MDPFAELYFQQENEEICGLAVPSITEDYIENIPSIVDRFFTRHYYIKPGAKREPYLVLFHSNRVCLIGLALEHPVFKDGIQSVSFDIGNMDRSRNQVSGKGKKGGMALQQDSTLALVTGIDGNTYKVPSCIKGKLIEVNPRIVTNPELMKEVGNGYLAIVLPKPEHCNEIRSNLLSEEQYKIHLTEEQRTNNFGMDPFAELYFQQENEEICGLTVPSITEDYIENIPSIVDRFFTRHYYIKPGVEREPYLVLFHSNRVCLIGLALQHPVFKEGIKSVSFDIGNMDRSQNQVSGKGKKGGMALQQDSTLALVTGSDGNTYKVPSCIKGKLIEVNPRIVTNPELMKEVGNGYLAIVLPKPEHCNEIRSSLLTEEQYKTHLKEERSKGLLVTKRL